MALLLPESGLVWPPLEHVLLEMVLRVLEVQQEPLALLSKLLGPLWPLELRGLQQLLLELEVYVPVMLLVRLLPLVLLVQVQVLLPSGHLL